MISAVLIVKNEESCLEECLESIKGLDEIIICDTGSEDNTIEIAKRYTDKIYTDYKWNDSMCEARNHALSKATGDWILSIDADEVLESVDVLKAEIAKYSDEQLLHCILKPKNGAKEHFLFPRVFRRTPKIYWKGAIHNYLTMVAKTTSEIVIKYGYSDAHKKDPDRALRILGKEVIKDPNCIREKFYLAREYWYRKDWETAMFWYEDYLKKAWWPPEMSEANLQIAKCCCNLKKYDMAKAYCLRAILINADFKEALEMMVKLTGPKNSKKWQQFVNLAKNQDVLFIR